MGMQSSFDYRLVKTVLMLPGDVPYPEFSVRQIWYNEDGEIETYSPEPATAQSDNIEDVKRELEFMLKAFNKPILEEMEFEPGIVELVTVEKVQKRGKKV